MEYQHDIFYDAYQRPLKEKVEICNWAKERCFNWRVDELDCSKSWARKQVDMSYEDIMNKLDDDAHFVVIHRKGFENMKNKPREYMGEWCLEVGFRTGGSAIDYFLWIYCKEELVHEIIKQFKLEKL